MRRYPVFYRGAPCGEITALQEGLYLHFRARVVYKGTGIPRIYLKGEKGVLLLGVAEPGEGAYILRRSLAGSSVEKLGVLQRGELRVQGENKERWQPLRQEEIQLCRRFSLALPPLTTGLFRGTEEGKKIAFPFGEWQAFPMSALFCFARIERIGGSTFAVFSFDKGGNPIFVKK